MKYNKESCNKKNKNWKKKERSRTNLDIWKNVKIYKQMKKKE